MKPTAALLGFHLRSGARLAMRAGLPATAALTVAVGLSADPGATLRLAAEDLAGRSGSPVVALVLVVVAAGISAWAAPRICHGAAGWVRHLPASWSAHRRALLGAVAAAQLPVAMAWLGLWLLAWRLGANVDPRRLLALPAVLAGIALVAVPSRRRIATAAAGVGTVVLALSGSSVGLLVAWLVPLAAERLFVLRVPRASRGLLWRARASARWVPALIAFRAVGPRYFSTCLPALLPLAAAWLFVRNNEGIATAGPLRFATGTSVALVVAGLAGELASRRPPWRWARSLPWSASDRVGHDAAWLALPTLPVLVAFGVLLDGAAALTTAVGVPLVVVRATTWLRRTDAGSGTWARVAGEGLFVAAWFGVTAWSALPAVALVVVAWRVAARRDRELDVSRWSPRDHLATGDPVSWRGL